MTRRIATSQHAFSMEYTRAREGRQAKRKTRLNNCGQNSARDVFTAVKHLVLNNNNSEQESNQCGIQAINDKS